MARLPRYVIPGQPQHIIQRGNNRQAIFAAEADYQFFRDALVEAAAKHGLAVQKNKWGQTRYWPSIHTKTTAHSNPKQATVSDGRRHCVRVRLNETWLLQPKLTM